MDATSQEIIASAFAAAVSVVGLLKGFAYISDKRNGGEEKQVTLQQCNDLRTTCAQQRAELKTDTALYRADTKEDTRIYRAESREDSASLSTRLNAMQREIKDEIIKLGEKVDGLASGIPKDRARK
jgi:predicted lipase